MDNTEDGYDPPILLRVEAAARLMGLSSSSMFNLIRSGEIAVVRFGTRGIRVPRAVIEQWVLDRTVAPTKQRT